MATKNHIPESATAAPMYELEDVWLNAFAQLPDAKPLAALLRDYSTSMPPGARDLLAELLNPGDPDIGGGRLTYTPGDGIGRAIDELLPYVDRYYTEFRRLKKVGESDPSQQAAEFVGKKYKRRDRTVYRKLRAWRALVGRLFGRD
jgi:hypothetical protein